MENMLAIYETNWSLFGVDGQLLPGQPSNPLAEQWHQQDDLKKDVEGVGPPSMMDKLVRIQEEIGELDETWLDSKTDLVDLLLGKDDVAISEPNISYELAQVTQPAVSEEEAIEHLLESLEREVPDGIVDLDNGQVGSQSLLELLTSDMDSQGNSEAVVGTLTPDDIDSILSSNPSSPGESIDSDPNWSPSGGSETNGGSIIKSRPAPYEKEGRSLYSRTDKKLRKKEQNRTAATRYRHKKRQEQDCTTADFTELEDKNKELKEQVNSISQEIAYLKKLMAEVYKARQEMKK